MRWIRLNLKIWLSYVVIVFISGCFSSVIRPEPYPEPSLPEEFSNSGTNPISPRWWVAFQDDQLNCFIDRALSGNLDLLAAWDRLDQAYAVARKSKAMMWPSAEVSLSASRSRIESGNDAGPGEFSPSSEESSGDGTLYLNSFTASLSVSYELDLWGRVRSLRRAAGKDYCATNQDLTAMAMTVSAEVAETYFLVQQHQATVKLLQDQIKTGETFLDLVKLRYLMGRASGVDVIQQKRQLQSTLSELPKTKLQLSMQKRKLRLLLGESGELKLESKDYALPDLPPLPETGIPADIIFTRPDIRSSKLRLEAANERVAAAIADRLPSLRLTAGAQSDAAELSDLFDNWLTNIAANLLAPIFDAGSRAAESDRAEAAAREKFHYFKKDLLIAVNEVEDALIGERWQEEYVVSLREQVDLSRQSANSSRDRFLKGATDYLPVLESLTSLQRLERSLLDAQRQLLSYRIGLYRALGGGWNMERPNDSESTHNLEDKEGDI